MAYRLDVELDLEKELFKLSKSNKALHIQLLKKVKIICENPQIGKPLRNKYRGIWRVHIGSFVLKYKIDENQNLITLLTFEHHDEAYK